MTRHVKSTAKLWKQSRHLATKYRDRKTIRLADGSPMELVGYGPTKHAATEDLYAKVDAELEVHLQAETISVTHLFAEFLQHKRSVKGNKAKTIYDDTAMFKGHVQPKIGDKPLAEVTLPEIQGIQHALTSQGKWRSAERCTILIKALLGFAAKRYRSEIVGDRLQLVARDDVDNIKRPPGTKRKTNPLSTLAQVEGFLQLARERYEKHPRNIFYPVFYAALEAGLRRGELLRMQRSALTSAVYRGKRQ